MGMYHVAVIEDEREAAEALSSMLGRYASENQLEIEVTLYVSALEFEMTHHHFDLVFMDIQMPGIDGMEAALLMRTYDDETPIIFVTNLAQYAIRGYEVGALDFIVKPISYYNFKMRMDKAVRHIRRNVGRSISLSTRDGMRIVSLADIEYVEISKHDLSYHLCGEESPLVVYGSLVAFEKVVEGGPFVRISKSCLVNMNLIRFVKGSALTMRGGDTLFFSRSKKREALETIAGFLGGSI